MRQNFLGGRSWLRNACGRYTPGDSMTTSGKSPEIMCDYQPLDARKRGKPTSTEWHASYPSPGVGEQQQCLDTGCTESAMPMALTFHEIDPCNTGDHRRLVLGHTLWEA